MEHEIDLLRDELGKILKQIQEETEGGDPNYEIEEIHGVNLKELEKAFEDNHPKMTLEFIKIHADAISPSYNYPTDSGFDLHSTEDVMVEGLGRALVPTGLRFDIPMGHEIQVRPKSGLALKEGLTVLNTPGTVDAGYDGEVKVIIYNTNAQSYQIKKGQKIAQAVLCPVINGKFVTLHEVIELDEKERGSNGFGSTGI